MSKRARTSDSDDDDFWTKRPRPKPTHLVVPPLGFCKKIVKLGRDFLTTYGYVTVRELKTCLAGKVVLVRNRKNEKDQRIMKLIRTCRAGGKHRFSAEDSVLRHVQHPYIIKSFMSFVGPLYHGFILPYYKEGDLAQKVKDIPFCVALRYFCQIGEALEYLHSRGFIHGDLKLENVLISNDGDHAVMMDFGQSQMVSRHNSMVDQWLGTVGCVAPEAESGKPMCAFKMDMWSFGVMFWEVLTAEDDQFSKKTVTTELVLKGTLRMFAEPFRIVLQSLLDFDPVTRSTAAEINNIMKSRALHCPLPGCPHETRPPSPPESSPRVS